MIAILAIIIFVSAALLAIGVIATMVIPQWRRIARLASGQDEAQGHEVIS